eukprot:6078595-Amphidinium_carterae.1
MNRLRAQCKDRYVARQTPSDAYVDPSLRVNIKELLGPRTSVAQCSQVLTIIGNGGIWCPTTETGSAASRVRR